jgi:hypothetical protein
MARDFEVLHRKTVALNEFFPAAVEQGIAVCCADLAFCGLWHTAWSRTVESALVDGAAISAHAGCD